MTRTLLTLTAAALLGSGAPALAGQPLGWFDERYPFPTNKAREAFPNAPERGTAESARPYALTGTAGTTSPTSEGLRMKVDTVGLYPRTIYQR